MANDQHPPFSRRGFVQSGLLAGGAFLARPAAARAADAEPATLPRRVLGRTNASLPVLTLGTAPSGFAKPQAPENVVRCIHTALELGVNAIDTAPAYDVAEQGVGMALGSRRKEVFLSTKLLADEIAKAEKILANSLRVLKTDYIDLVYFHSVGDRNVEIALAPQGVLTWLLKQKQAGTIRFVGISGHNRPQKFLPLLESGQIDALLTVVNFVDRHTYNFEEKVLPVARKHKVGIVAMKVFGGAKGGNYQDPQGPSELDSQHFDLAVRYALSVPGVTTLNIGAHNPEQVRKNVQLARTASPLTAEEQQRAAILGRELAAKWGPHFGPLAGMPQHASRHC